MSNGFIELEGEEKEYVPLSSIYNNTNNDNFLAGNISNIFDNNKIKESVLCMGQVQSGKTKNIIECIKKARTLGYKCCFYIAGTTKDLVAQSNNRIEQDEDFKKWRNDVEIEWYNGTSKLDNISYYLNKIIKDDFFLLFTVLKEKTNLEKTYNFFFENACFSDMKILFIDDECDYASIDQNNSAIYKILNEMYSKIKQGKILYVTATPYANILSNSSTGKINRSVVLKHYDKYCGSDYFVNTRKNKNFVKINLCKEDYSGENDVLDQEVNNLLSETIFLWLYSTAVCEIENQEMKSEFLVNIDSFTHVHVKLKQCIFDKLNSILSQKANLFESFTTEKSFKERFEQISDTTAATPEKILDKIHTIIETIFAESSIYVVNGTGVEYVSGQTKYAIIIGGVKVSRGFTYSFLITELILNCPLHQKIPFDTLLQRARWFGNRMKNIEYISIVLNEKILNAYIEGNELINRMDEIGNSIFDSLLYLKKKENELQFLSLTNKKL